MPVLPFERLTDAQLEVTLKLQHPFLTAVESDPDSWFKVPAGVGLAEPLRISSGYGTRYYSRNPVWRLYADNWHGSVTVERRSGAGEVWVKFKEVEG